MVGGHAAAGEAVEEHRDPAAPRRAPAARASPCAPVQVAAGHDHRALGLAQQRDRARELVAVGLRPAAGSGSAGPASRLVGLGEHVVEREVDERRAGVGRAATAASASSTSPGISAVDSAVAANFVSGADERHVVDLLQRALPPAPRGRAAAEHDHRRVVLLRRPASALIPFVTPGPGGQRRHAGPARDLRPALGGERRGRLVAHVDEVDALGAAAVVDREQVPAREREQLRDAVRLQPARGEQPPAVGGRRLVSARCHQPRLVVRSAPLAVGAARPSGARGAGGPRARSSWTRSRLPCSSTVPRSTKPPCRLARSRRVASVMSTSSPVSRVTLLDARRGVHGVADHGELQAPAAADGARDDRPRVDADADGERVPVSARARPRRSRSAAVDAAVGVAGSGSGAPNTASSPSPMNLFAWPPWWLEHAARRSRRSSLSRRRPRARDERSANAGEVADVEEEDRDLDLLALRAPRPRPGRGPPARDRRSCRTRRGASRAPRGPATIWLNSRPDGRSRRVPTTGTRARRVALRDALGRRAAGPERARASSAAAAAISSKRDRERDARPRRARRRRGRSGAAPGRRQRRRRRRR